MVVHSRFVSHLIEYLAVLLLQHPTEIAPAIIS
jgi:hypothetical protein